MNYIIDSRICNLIKKTTEPHSDRNKFKFHRGRVLPKISRQVISQNGYTVGVASVSPPARTISTHRTLVARATQPEEPSLKLFRNEISRGTKRDYGGTFCSCRARARARVAARSHTSNCRPGVVASAYDTVRLG